MKNISRFKNFLHVNNSGGMFLEFALTVPLLIIIFYGLVEFSRFALVKQKVSNANTAIVNMMNQIDKDGLDLNTLNYIASALPESLQPYQSDDWEIMVNAVYQSEGTNCDVYSLWQIKRAAGNSKRTSKIADGGGKKAVIPGYENKFKPGDQLITIELFMTYKPLIDNYLVKSLGLQDYQMYTFFIARPRYGSFSKNPETGNVVTPVCKVTA